MHASKTKNVGSPSRKVLGLPLYQPHPIANAFTFDPSEAHRPCQPSSTGGISRVMDKGINKLVYRIRGSVPSSNFLEPNKKVSDLCLTGNYIYIVTKKLSSQPLTMHLDFVSAKNHAFRISISSFFETPRMAGTSTLRIPFSYFSPDGASSPPWTVVALDVRATVKKFSPEAFANDRVSHLRTLKVCSHATLYGAFTSDICHDMESLCKCISVSTQPELMRWLPSKPKQLQKASVKKAKKGSKAEEMDENAPTQMKIRVSASKKRDLPVPPAPTPLSPQSNNGNGRTDNPEANPLISPPIPPRPQAKIAVKGASVLKKIGSPPIPPRRPRPTKPTRLIGCGGTVDNLSWSKSDTALTFPCSNCIVTMETPRVDDGEGPDLDALLSQETISTSSLINLSAISPSSALLATASSKELKVYDAQRGACLASVVILNETEGMPVPLPPVSLSFSIDEQLVAVCHYDAQRRQCITVFSLTGPLEQLEKTTENLQKGVVQKTLPLVAKQTSDFPISAIKFTPYDSKKLVSCGKENVRFWRIKSSHLPACPVILNEFARNTVFTDLAFESSYGMLDDTDTPKIVFAATSLGTLLQISYHSRTVLCVLKLHDGPINTVAVNEGYAVTGSDDKYLRLWPLDFSDFLLEAQHDAPVTKICLSLDGLKLLVGTGSGTIGVLDVVTQSYATVMRSHASGILSLASDFERKEFASVGQDKTIRVWSSVNGRQKYEFLSPHDTPTCVAYHPNSQTIVCGFDSGYVRVFDVVTTSTLHELEQHTGVVKSLIFSKDGNIVYTVATDGHISMFDVTQEYLPLKTVACDVPADGCMLALSPDGSQLVAPGPEKNAITLYDAQTLVPIRKIVYKRGEVMEECPFEYIAFAGEDVIVVFTKSRVVYFSKGGKLASDQLPGQGGGAFAQSADGRFFACASKESSGDLKSNFVYIWKHGGNGRIGGGVVKEVKRCGGMWSGVTALEFSDDDKTLLASDETGVTYVWDLGDMGSEDEDEEEGWVVIDEEEGEILSPRASIKALSLDEQPTAIMTPRSSETKAAIKALSASPVVETPKTPMRADRVMSLVLNEMLKRSWISASTAAIMASPACPELPILLAAVEAFSINQDFDELLDTFLMTSKHIVAAEAEAEKEKEEVEDLDEDEESSVDEDVTKIPSLSPFLTRHKEKAEKAEKSLPPALPAGPFGLLRVLGGDGTALLWAPSNGLIAYSAGNTCVLEDLESQQQWLAQHDAASTVQCLAMTEDCNTVASGSAEGGRLCLRVWAREGDEMKAVHAEGVLDKTGVDTLAFVFSETQVVAGGVEGFVVFDLLQGRVVWQTQAASMDSIAALSASTFVSGGSSGLTLWREAERGLDSEKIELTRAHNRVSSVSVSPDGRYIVAGNTAGGLEIWSVEAGEVVEVFDDAVMGAVAFVEAKQNKLVVSNGKLIAGYEIEYGEEGVKIDKEGGVVTSVKAGVVAMQWDESGEEGVVGTSGGGVKYLELGSHEEIDLIKPLTGLEKCAKSSDDKFFAAVGGEEIVIFSVEEGAGLKELCRIAVGYDAASVKCTNVAFGCPPGAKDSRILVAAAFSNCKVKVVSADTVKIGEFSVCEASLERSRAVRKGLMATDDGCYNLAFVDDDGHLATGGSDGELLLTPIAYNASGKVILRQETFDLLEHQKSESGEFVDGDVDWRWTAVEAHPRDPSTWCCSKLKVGAESTKPQAHVYLFQNGQNTHTISVLDVFTEANNPVPNPTFFSTKFSLSRPGFLQCSLGQGDSSCVVTFNMLDPSGVPKVDSIVQLDETCVRRMGLSSTGIMAAVADESVVLMKEKGEPIQCIDVGGLGGDAEITEDGTCIFSVGKDGVAVFNLKG